VQQVITRFQVGTARACRLMSLQRSVYYYHEETSTDNILRCRIIELAQERKRFGYRRIHLMLLRGGWKVNHKRVYRIYQEEKLSVRKRKRKKGTGYRGEVPVRPNGPGQRWSMDFVHDSLANGLRIRTLNIVDDFTRECVAIEVDTSINGKKVAKVLERLRSERGLPNVLLSDNGPEFTGKDMSNWAYARNQKHQFIQPGKPVQNCFVESFNGKFRDECLNEHWFQNVEYAREIIADWKIDYNHNRPHSSLGGKTPEEFARNLIFPPPPEEGERDCFGDLTEGIIHKNQS
jgi:putative transposase